MDISSFLGGNFFSQVDLTQPAQVMTIGRVDQQLVGQGPTADTKVCVTFTESPKSLALNRTNLKRVAAMFGTNANVWAGKQLLVYRSSTTFAGEAKLCVRVCGPQQAPPDPICDLQGNVVPYAQAVQTASPPVAAPVVTPPPVQAPAAQQPLSTPFESAHDNSASA